MVDQSPDSVRLLGVRIDCVVTRELLDFVVFAVREERPVSVMYVNVHCMNVRHNDPQYAAILEKATRVYCDGTGVRLGAWMARLRLPTRMTAADWIADLCQRAVQENLSVFLLGSVPGSAHDAAFVLKSRFPELRIAGALPGFNRGDATVQAINQSNADILLVGMGTPTQERWISEHREQLDVPVVWAVGALFDFVSGRIPRGPRWLTDNGLEWLCRIVVEPRKLWRRYLIGNPLFLARVVQYYWLGGKPFGRR